jgi:hypothetical protein
VLFYYIVCDDVRMIACSQIKRIMSRALASLELRLSVGGRGKY